MERVFLEYYEDELRHIRGLASEFADMHPAVARNLSLDTVPCPDPYVERLLEGVAYLAARTRLKVDGESSRFTRNILESLYPDLVGPAPAMTMAVLEPGPQVRTMQNGHVVERGTRMISGLREGLDTRATYTTAQDVTLWPVKLTKADYLRDKGAMAAAGLTNVGDLAAETALSLTFEPNGEVAFADMSLDTLDIYFANPSTAPAIFDAIFGASMGVCARPEGRDNPVTRTADPAMIGVGDAEGLLPRSRPTFEGYRLLREYFLMPERFYYTRLADLNPVIRKSGKAFEVIILLDKHCPGIVDVKASDFALFAVPIVNLFERDCNVIELDGRRPQQAVHADRTRTRDFETYMITRVEDADTEGPDALIPPLFSLSMSRGTGVVYSTERRPRRPGEDERRDGQTRTTYAGDDVFIAISRPANAPQTKPLKRIDIRALCTNRDLAILDDSPQLAMDTGDPVTRIRLLNTMKPPRRSLPAVLPKTMTGESRMDDLSWRLISQLSLNYLSLADETRGAEPLKAMLALYADRGDPSLARHIRAVTRLTSTPAIERLAIAGPMCFGRGEEITLFIDETMLSGHSELLLSALLDKLFQRHAGINSIIRTRTRLMQKQEDVLWPTTPGNRCLI